MSILKPFYEVIHESAKNVSPLGTGMGGIFILDNILAHVLKPSYNDSAVEGKKQEPVLPSKK